VVSERFMVHGWGWLSLSRTPVMSRPPFGVRPDGPNIDSLYYTCISVWTQMALHFYRDTISMDLPVGDGAVQRQYSKALTKRPNTTTYHRTILAATRR
jgi:hypothetical protein